MQTLVKQATGTRNAAEQLKGRSRGSLNVDTKRPKSRQEIHADDTDLWTFFCEVPIDVDAIEEYLKTEQCETNIRDKVFGWYPVLVAADAGKPGLLKLLLGFKAKPDVVCREGNSALILAARNGHLEAVEFLMSRKADLNAKNIQGWSALHWSCINGHEDIATSLLVASANFNLEDNDGRTACMWAARHGNVEIVEALLVCGINLGAQDHAGLTAMDHAREHMNLRTVIAAAEEVNRDLLEAARRADKHAMKSAIEKGADVNLHDENGWSALMWSALHGTLDLVTMLVRHGANPTLLEDSGDHIDKLGDQHLVIRDSLLSILGANDRMLSMAKEQKWDEVEVCLKIGAWVNVRDKDKRTALMWAARHGAPAAISMLVNRGAHIDERDIFGWTATLFAVWSKSVEAVAMLYFLSADFAIRSFEGDSALHVAVRANDGAMVQMLLAAKTDIEEKDVQGYSPLMLSASTGVRQTTSTLLAWGASLKMTDNHQRTPFMLAIMNGHQSITQLMLEPLQAPPAIPGFEQNDKKSKSHDKKSGRDIDADANPTKGTPKKSDAKVLFSDKPSDLKRGSGKAKAKLKDMNAPRAVKGEGPTALIQMAAKMRSEVIGKLPKISAKSLLKESDKDGRAPLHLTVIKKDIDIMQLLISKTSDINAVDSLGNTALHEAALRNQEQVVSNLLEASCDIALENKDKSVPIDLAEDQNIKGMLQRTAVARAMRAVDAEVEEDERTKSKTRSTKERPIFRARIEGLPTDRTGDVIEGPLRAFIKTLGVRYPTKVDIVVDPITSRPLGYAKVQCGEAAEVDLIIRGDGMVLEGNILRIFKDSTAPKKRT